MIDPQQIQNMRAQGLTDAVIQQELTSQGHNPVDVQAALQAMDYPSMPGSVPGGMPSPAMPASGGAKDQYGRMEEIAESIIDEKWDELIAEVRKIVDWKEKIEEKQVHMDKDLQKLKEDFTMLHKGVLGRLEDYDTRMQDVGTELKAVGKVFKDVIPEFVENVKELKSIKEEIKK